MSAVDHAVENILEEVDDAVADLSESRTENVYEAILTEMKDRLGIVDADDVDDNELPSDSWDGCPDCGSEPCVCDSGVDDE